MYVSNKYFPDKQERSKQQFLMKYSPFPWRNICPKSVAFHLLHRRTRGFYCCLSKCSLPLLPAFKCTHSCLWQFALLHYNITFFRPWDYFLKSYGECKNTILPWARCCSNIWQILLLAKTLSGPAPAAMKRSQGELAIQRHHPPTGISVPSALLSSGKNEADRYSFGHEFSTLFNNKIWLFHACRTAAYLELKHPQKPCLVSRTFRFLFHQITQNQLSVSIHHRISLVLASIVHLAIVQQVLYRDKHRPNAGRDLP